MKASVAVCQAMSLLYDLDLLAKAPVFNGDPLKFRVWELRIAIPEIVVHYISNLVLLQLMTFGDHV
jgi:hypothetical protein